MVDELGEPSKTNIFEETDAVDDDPYEIATRYDYDDLTTDDLLSNENTRGEDSIDCTETQPRNRDLSN